MDAERYRNSNAQQQQQNGDVLPVIGNLQDLSHAKAVRLALLQGRDEQLLASAVNNFSVATLSLKLNMQSIQRLEALLGEDPLVYMTDAVVFNLCTMYDLSFSPDVSAGKKKVLQKVALRFGLVDPILLWRSFRAN